MQELGTFLGSQNALREAVGVLIIIALALKKTKYGVIAKVGEGNGATPATY